jgi:hypothetical protein
MRNLLYLAFIVAFVGFIYAFGTRTPNGQSQGTERSVPTVLTQEPRPLGAVGGTYTLAYVDRLWVNRLGLDAWNRAEADKDKKSQDRIDGAFENFFVQPGTRVQVVVRDGKTRQLDVLSGPYAGRRGWTDTYSDAQYIP